MIFLQFLFVGILGGTTGALIKYAVVEIPPVLLITIRFGISSLLILHFVIKANVLLPKNNYHLVFASSLMLTANVLLFAIGVQNTSVIMSQIIYVPTSLIVAVLGYVLLKEKLTKNQIVGLVITLAGMIILALGSIRTQDIHSFGKPFGNFLIFIALFCWALYLVFSRKVVKDYSPLQSAFYNFIIAFALSSVLVPIEAISSSHRISALSPTTIFATGALVVSSTSFIFLYQRFIQRTSAFIASLITYVNPITAALIGVTFFDETLEPSLIVGGFIIFVGVFIATSYNYLRDKINKS